MTNLQKDERHKDVSSCPSYSGDNQLLEFQKVICIEVP